MTNLQVLKTLIENANALGRVNLAGKGVEAPENATTYDIMSLISSIAGAGVEYSSVKHNDDGTITLTDTDGVNHIVSYKFEGTRIVSVTYDCKKTPITFNENELVKFGDTDISLTLSQSDRLYEHYGVDKATYPYVVIYWNNGNLRVVFGKSYIVNKFGSSTSTGLFSNEYPIQESDNFPNATDYANVVTFAIDHIESVHEMKGAISSSANHKWWSNIKATDWLTVGTNYPFYEPNVQDFLNGFALGLSMGNCTVPYVPFVWEKDLTFALNEDLGIYSAECDDIDIPDGSYTLSIDGESRGVITTKYEDSVGGYCWFDENGEIIGLHYELEGVGGIGFIGETIGNHTVTLTEI